MTLREKAVEYFVLSTVMALGTVFFSYFFGTPRDDIPSPIPTASDERPTLSSIIFIIEFVIRRCWKILAGLVLILCMELVQELGHHGMEGLRIGRVLRLQSFREMLRGLVRGQLPEAAQDPDTSGSTPTSEEAAEDEVIAAAAYANERAARKRADAAAMDAMEASVAAVRRLEVDHLVYGVDGPLEEAMARFEEKTGVRPRVGGSHPSLGTHNALVSLGGGAYFEILCVDPEQVDPPRRWMGIERLAKGESAMLTWAVGRAGHLAETVAIARAEGYDAGDVTGFARQRPDGSMLRWSLGYRHYTVEQMGAGRGVVPFLIDWHGSASPAATAPEGCALIGLRAEVVDYAAVRAHLLSVGVDPEDLHLVEGPKDRLVALLRTPKGLVEF